MRLEPSATKNNAGSRCSPVASLRWRPASNREGSRSVEAEEPSPGRIITSLRPRSPRPSGRIAGAQRAFSSPRTGKRTRPGGTRRSAFTQMSTGWSQASPQPLPTSPTGRTAATGSLVKSPSPIGAEEVAAQAATGAVRYDISFAPDNSRWYLDASWKLPTGELETLEDLRRGTCWASTSTKVIWRRWCSMLRGTRWAVRASSRWHFPGSMPSPVTATCVPPLQGSSPWPGRVGAGLL